MVVVVVIGYCNIHIAWIDTIHSAESSFCELSEFFGVEIRLGLFPGNRFVYNSSSSCTHGPRNMLVSIEIGIKCYRYCRFDLSRLVNEGRDLDIHVLSIN